MAEENGVFNKDFTRREAMKTALKAGAYAAPVVLSAMVPAVGVAAATPPSPTGTLTGTITNAGNGQPISGATVSVGGVSATTNGSGVYTLNNAPAGTQTVTTSAPGFTSRSNQVNIAANSSTTFSTSLAAGNITIVLRWGTLPTDMDAHLTGPDVVNGGRFEVFWNAMTPVPYASLDQDVYTGLGPETVTVQKYTVTNQFVPGDYHYFVDNYSAEVGYTASSASVTVFQAGTQIAQFLAANATGNSASEWWQVFNFTLAADGTPTITPIMTLTNATPSTVVPKPQKRH